MKHDGLQYLSYRPPPGLLSVHLNLFQLGSRGLPGKSLSSETPGILVATLTREEVKTLMEGGLLSPPFLFPFLPAHNLSQTLISGLGGRCISVDHPGVGKAAPGSLGRRQSVA